MNTSTPQVMNGQKISAGRLLFISFFGPPIGIIAYLAVAFLIEWPDEEWHGIIEIALSILILGWPLGIIASALAALVWRFIPKPSERMAKLGLALAVGAIAAPLGMGLVMAFVLDVAPMDFALGVLFASAGAIAMAATAIPYSKA